MPSYYVDNLSTYDDYVVSVFPGNDSEIEVLSGISINESFSLSSQAEFDAALGTEIQNIGKGFAAGFADRFVPVVGDVIRNKFTD